MVASSTNATLPADSEALAWQVFARPPIYDSIFAYCTALSLIRLARTTRLTRTASLDFQRRAFDINKRLKRFVGDPVAFRALMARTGMILSGSFALQFFDRNFWPESDLDCYLTVDYDAAEVGAFLIRAGYRFCPGRLQSKDFRVNIKALVEDIVENMKESCEPEDFLESEHEEDLVCLMQESSRDSEGFASAVGPYGIRWVRAVYTFERGTGDDARKVQLILSRFSPFASILKFHCTCVMNVITHNAAYCLYPYATLEARSALDLGERTSKQVEAFSKYSRRGWRILTNPRGTHRKAEDAYAPFFVDAPRFVCDAKSWTIPFADPISWDATAECGWELESGLKGIRCRFMAVKTPVFRWQYTSPNGDHCELVEELIERGGGGPWCRSGWEHRHGGNRASTRWDKELLRLRERFLDPVEESYSDMEESEEFVDLD